MIPRAVLLVVCGLLFIGAPATRGEEPAARAEARVVKAAYIYNFTKFIVWRAADESADPRAPITIGVLGRDVVASTLTENSPLESRGRPLRVVPVARGEKLPPCHVLYIALSEATHLADALEQVQNTGVLTVSDLPHFIEAGGMIGFVEERGRVRIDINLPGIRAAGLTVSSKLLEVARNREGGKR